MVLKRDHYPVVACIVILAVFMVLTIRRNETWGNKIRLWEDVTEKSPMKPRGFLNLGVAYQEVGEYPKALDAYQRCAVLSAVQPDKYAIAMNTGASALANMASIYIDVHQFDDAQEVLILAKRDFPPFQNAMTNQVVIFMRTNQWDAALYAANEALTAWPNAPVLHFNRGDILGKMGRCEEAQIDWQTAQALDRTTRYPVRTCKEAA